jgi:hypothetical protein
MVSSASLPVSFALPPGWHWVMRGDDLIATRDGVFLQNITIERIYHAQTDQSDGLFPLAALSSKQWPFRTVKNLKKRLVPGMSSTDAADSILAAQSNNPNVSDFKVLNVVLQDVAGSPGFRALYELKLNLQERSIRYQGIYCGLMVGKWFYGINYTAVQRYYFEKDAGTFESILQSVRLAEK